MSGVALSGRKAVIVHGWSDNYPPRLFVLNRPISPNLSYHRLVHFQIRRGLLSQAAMTVSIMIFRGFRVRTLTLVAVVRAACLERTQRRDQHIVPEISIFSPASQRPPHCNLYTFAAQQSQYYGTSLAFKVVNLAAKKGYAGVDHLYAAVIETCLSRGEGIVASILYRSMLQNHHDEHLSCRLSANLTAVEEVRGEKRYKDISQRLFEKLMKWVVDGLEEGPEARRRASLQTLMNLIALVEDGLDAVKSLAPMFDALALCPKSNYHVWIFRKELYSVNFHQYSQNFVLRYMDKVIRQRSDHNTCQALMDYALCRFNSPRLVDEIFNFARLLPDEASREHYLDLLVQSGAHMRRGNFTRLVWDKHLMWNIEQIHRGPACVPYPWDAELDKNEKASALNSSVATVQLTFHAETVAPRSRTYSIPRPPSVFAERRSQIVSLYRLEVS